MDRIIKEVQISLGNKVHTIKQCATQQYHLVLLTFFVGTQRVSE